MAGPRSHDFTEVEYPGPRDPSLRATRAFQSGLVMEKGMRRDLVEAARRGDHEAFEVLATSAADRLYAVARLIVRDSGLAEDAVQEALVRAWRQLPSLRDPDRFDAWLYRLVVNACADQGRQQRRWSQQVRPLVLDVSVGDETGSVADREQLERGFRRLKPEQRAVVVLHYYSGFSAAEIAGILGIPQGTARSRLHYATEAMRAALRADARQPAAAQEWTA